MLLPISTFTARQRLTLQAQATQMLAWTFVFTTKLMIRILTTNKKMGTSDIIESNVDVVYKCWKFIAITFSFATVQTSGLHSTPLTPCTPLNRQGKRFTIKHLSSFSIPIISCMDTHPFFLPTWFSYCLYNETFWLSVSRLITTIA